GDLCLSNLLSLLQLLDSEVSRNRLLPEHLKQVTVPLHDLGLVAVKNLGQRLATPNQSRRRDELGFRNGKVALHAVEVLDLDGELVCQSSEVPQILLRDLSHVPCLDAARLRVPKELHIGVGSEEH